MHSATGRLVSIDSPTCPRWTSDRAAERGRVSLLVAEAGYATFCYAFAPVF